MDAFPREHREKLRKFIVRDYEENDTFVPDGFKSTDYRDVYAVEGLAYQYWLTTAQLRSLGKGSRLFFHETGEFLYEPDDNLEEAISRYDDRLGSERFFATLIGVVSEAKAKSDTIKALLLLAYNVTGVDVAPALERMRLHVQSATGTPIANFVPRFLSISNFSNAHSYLETEFVDRWGFGVSEIGYVLWALANLALLPHAYLSNPDQPLGTYFLRLLKRGYAIYSAVGDETWGALRDRLAVWMELESDHLESIMAKAPSIIDMISLTEAKQKVISPWSRGPRPIVLPYGNFLIIDVAGIGSFLQRVFTGVRDDGQTRGELFEDTVRTSVASVLPNSWQMAPQLFRKNGELKHEADVVLVDGEEAYVGECFTMWMPLNFDIGDETTIANRLQRVNEKLDQANDVCDFLRLDPAGDNYDFSKIKKFIPIVISPFVEWLPATSDRYWLKKDMPRVMSADEFVVFVQEGGLKGAVGKEHP